MNYLKEKDPEKEKNKNDVKKDAEDTEDKEEKFLAGIPFDYNLSEARLNNKLMNSIFSPSKLEPRITGMTMTQNNIDIKGFFELAQVLLFNKNIKKIYLDSSKIKSNYLNYLNIGLGVYDNYNLELLNLSSNNINKDSDEYLVNIISHLKGLKIINLSNNNMKNGVARFFVMLKR